MCDLIVVPEMSLCSVVKSQQLLHLESVEPNTRLAKVALLVGRFSI